MRISVSNRMPNNKIAKRVSSVYRNYVYIFTVFSKSPELEYKYECEGISSVCMLCEIIGTIYSMLGSYVVFQL